MPLRPPALLKNLSALDGSGYSVAAPLDVILDELEVSCRQDVRRVGVHSFLLNLPRPHPCDAAHGLHVEAF